MRIESFGTGAVLVRSLPALLGGADPASLLRDMAEALSEDAKSIVLERKLDAAIARLVCHGSIRAGRRLAAAEMDALLRQMEATPRRDLQPWAAHGVEAGPRGVGAHVWAAVGYRNSFT